MPLRVVFFFLLEKKVALSVDEISTVTKHLDKGRSELVEIKKFLAWVFPNGDRDVQATGEEKVAICLERDEKVNSNDVENLSGLPRAQTMEKLRQLFAQQQVIAAKIKQLTLNLCARQSAKSNKCILLSTIDTRQLTNLACQR